MARTTSLAAALVHLRMEGSNGATTFVDDANPLTVSTWTSSGGAALTNARALSGDTTSLGLSGSSQYIYSGTLSTIWWQDLDNTDFSIEAAVYVSGSFSGDHALVARWRADTQRRWWLGFTSTGQLNFTYYTGSVDVSVTSVATVSTGAWVHVRMVKMGTNIALFIDGVQVALNTAATAFAGTSTVPVYIGITQALTFPMPACNIAHVIIAGLPCYGDLTTTFTSPPPLLTNVMDSVDENKVDSLKASRSYTWTETGAGALPVSENMQFNLVTVIPGLGSTNNTDPATAVYSGTVYNEGLPASRTLKAYRRDTGQFVSSATSNSTTGAFSILLVPNVEHYVVCLDDDGAPVKNDLIKRKTITVP